MRAEIQSSRRCSITCLMKGTVKSPLRRQARRCRAYRATHRAIAGHAGNAATGTPPLHSGISSPRIAAAIRKAAMRSASLRASDAG